MGKMNFAGIRIAFAFGLMTMFQKIKGNALDSLKAAKAEINGLKNNTRALNLTIDSLNASVGTIKADLDQMTKTKNSI